MLITNVNTRTKTGAVLLGEQKMKNNAFKAETSLIKPESVQKPKRGRDELNLCDFPMASLSLHKKVFTPLQVSRIINGPDGQPIEQIWKVSGMLEQGIPLAMDEEVYKVLLYLSEVDGCFKNRDRELQFTTYTFCKTAGWPMNAGSYLRLKESLFRLFGCKILTRYAFYDKGKKRLTSEGGFGIIDEFKFYERRPKKNNTELDLHLWDTPYNMIRWNQTLFDSVCNGWVKELDLSFYLSLTKPLSKRLFCYLDKKMYKSSGYSADIKDICFNHLGMSRNYNAAQMKRELDKACAELNGKGFLSSWNYENNLVIFAKLDGFDVTKQARELVGHFRHKWLREKDLHGGRRELSQAKHLIKEVGAVRANFVVAFAMKKAPDTGFDMKFFGAVLSYKKEALAEFEKENKTAEERAKRLIEENKREEIRLAEESEHDKWMSVFKNLSEEEQSELRQKARAALVSRGRKNIRNLCIDIEIVEMLSRHTGRSVKPD